MFIKDISLYWLPLVWGNLGSCLLYSFRDFSSTSAWSTCNLLNNCINWFTRCWPWPAYVHSGETSELGGASKAGIYSLVSVVDECQASWTGSAVRPLKRDHCSLQTGKPNIPGINSHCRHWVWNWQHTMLNYSLPFWQCNTMW